MMDVDDYQHYAFVNDLLDEKNVSLSLSWMHHACKQGTYLEFVSNILQLLNVIHVIPPYS